MGSWGLFQKPGVLVGVPMATATLTKEHIPSGQLAVSEVSFTILIAGKHGSMQANRVLEKQLRVPHSDGRWQEETLRYTGQA